MTAGVNKLHLPLVKKRKNIFLLQKQTNKTYFHLESEIGEEGKPVLLSN